MKEGHLSQKTVAWVLACLLIVSLIPVLAISFYNHPATDDYAYGTAVHRCVAEDGNVLQILNTAISNTKNVYHTWQGTFTACFLMALQPGVFSDSLYWITTFVLLMTLCVAEYMVISSFVKNTTASPKSTAMILFVILFELTIQFIPDQREAFFWFNGGVYYTFYFALELLLTAGILREVYLEKRCALFTAGLALLGGIIGGGNFSTALTVTFMLVCLSAVLVVRKHTGAMHIVVITAVTLTCFVISVVAPGNAGRAQVIGDVGLSPWTAVFESLKNALQLIITWTRPVQLGVFLLITPLLYRLSGVSKWRFAHPLLITVLTFGFFASQMTPPLYAMNMIGEGRQIDLYYEAYCLMIPFLLYYWFGWFRKNIPKRKKKKSFAKQYWQSVRRSF